MAADSSVKVFEGSSYFRQRILLATLSRQSIKIKKIRHRDDEPGLRDYEISFIRLMDKLTNGTVIEINQTGTAIYYQPGVLIGGEISHNCNARRGIGYYLEMLLGVGPFCKQSLQCTLTGVTSDLQDPSVDAIKFSAFPIVKKFLDDKDGLSVVIRKRGTAPEGGGEVYFTCPIKPKLVPIQYLNPGKVKRIRGVAWACRTSPVMANRIMDRARGILNEFLADVFIYIDHAGPSRSGKSPGFGLTLWAETTEGAVYLAETCSKPRYPNDTLYTPDTPEDVGQEASYRLLEEIAKGGCVDSTNQSLALLLMVLGEPNVSKIQTGPLTPYSIQFLRSVRDFFGIMFKLDLETKPEEALNLGQDKIIASCIGVGFTNMYKKIL